jgi:hypothetical protein
MLERVDVGTYTDSVTGDWLAGKAVGTNWVVGVLRKGHCKSQLQ